MALRLTLSILLGCATLAAQTATTFNAALAQVEAYAAEEFTRDPIGSLAVGVVDGGTLAWRKSWGHANSETKGPATEETYYRIGSIRSSSPHSRCSSSPTAARCTSATR
jgi:CubicO group peptidase (beta-lactamase class C family)